MRLTRRNSIAPEISADPQLVTLSHLAVPGVDPADIAAFTAESRPRHIKYTRSEELCCPTCAAAKLASTATMRPAGFYLQPTRPGFCQWAVTERGDVFVEFLSHPVELRLG